MDPREKERVDINRADTERLIELYKNNKRNKEQEEEFQRLVNSSEVLIEAIKNPTSTQEKQQDVIYVAPKAAKHDLNANSYSDALIKAYKAKTGKEPIETEERIELSFSSQKEAVEFFKEQSKTLAFQAYNPKTDHLIYSDGKGTFVHGTKQQVSDYLKNPKDFKLGEDGKLDKKSELTETHTHKI